VPTCRSGATACPGGQAAAGGAAALISYLAWINVSVSTCHLSARHTHGTRAATGLIVTKLDI
jgi:hypothetical protein